MSYTYEELKKKRVVDLRDIAREHEHEALHGYSTMHKEDLIKALCTALGIEGHEHHEVKGIDKGTIKSRIRTLKTERDEAEAAHDRERLRRVRRQIHHLKRRIHKATV